MLRQFPSQSIPQILIRLIARILPPCDALRLEVRTDFRAFTRSIGRTMVIPPRTLLWDIPASPTYPDPRSSR